MSLKTTGPVKNDTAWVSRRFIHSILLSCTCLLAVRVPMIQAEHLIQILEEAERNEPKFLIAQKQHSLVKEILKQANAGLLPKITFDFDYLKTHQDIVSTSNPIYAQGTSDFKTEDYTLNLTQPVVDLPALIRRRQAKTEVERSDVELEDSLQELMVLVATKYFEALATQDGLNLIQAELAAVEEHYKLAQVRTSRGLSPLSDLYDASARLEAVKALRVESRNRRADALQAIREITGRVPRELATLRADFRLVKPVPEDGDLWVESAMKANLDLAIQRHTIEVARNEINLRKSGHWPTLSLFGRHNGRDAGGSLFGGGSNIRTTDLFFRFSVPFYQGGETTSRTRGATGLLEIAEIQQTEKTRAVVREVWASYSGLLGAIYKVRALAKAVEAQKLTLAAKKSGFESGLFAGMAVLDAEHEVNQALLNSVQARYDYLLYTLRLKRVVGGLGVEDLKRINGWLETRTTSDAKIEDANPASPR